MIYKTPCACCGRDSRGFGYRQPNNRVAKQYWACSLACVDYIRSNEEAMATCNDLTKFEERAIDKAGVAAGQYLETLGKFDLSLLSPSEWQQFLRTIYLHATEEVQNQRFAEGKSVVTDDDVPF
jgi:hypothetical protein